MKKLLLSATLFTCFTVLSSISASAESLEETPETTTTFMTIEEAKEFALDAEEQSGYEEDFEVTAYETDIYGNTIEVEPKPKDSNGNIIETLSISEGQISIMSPPKNSYKYVPSAYTSSSNSVVPRFKQIGSISVTNLTKSSVSAKYTQNSSVTTNWSVNSTISGNATFGASFLGKVTASVSGTAGKSKTVSKGHKIEVGTTVKPNATINMTAYQKGGKSSGKLLWKKYTASGSLVGSYSETTPGGVAPYDNGIQIDVTN